MVTEQPADLLLSKLEQLKALYSTWQTNVTTNRRYYNLDFEEEIIPQTVKDRVLFVVNPGTARRAIDEAVDHVLTRPEIFVPLRRSDEGNVKQNNDAALRRDFLRLFWANATQRFNMPGKLRKPLFSEGRVAARMVINWDALPDEPADADADDYQEMLKEYRKEMDRLGEEDEFLWDLDVLDNLSVWEDPKDHRNPRYVFVQYQVHTEEARRLFPRKTDVNAEDGVTSLELAPPNDWRNHDDYAMVTYTEYWSRPRRRGERGKFMQWIEQEAVHEAENPYPYVPVAIEDSGLGEEYLNATPEKKYVGLTQYMHNVFVAEARQMTSWEAITEISAFPVAMARNWREGKELIIGPGAITKMRGQKGEPGAEELEFLPWPQVPIGVIQLAEKTNALANDSLKMNTLGGTPLPGVETATEADQQIRNATSKLSGPVGAMERLCAKLSSWVLMTIDLVIESPVTLYGVGPATGELRLGPKQIDGFYVVRAELQTSDEDALNMVKARFWGEMYNLLPFMPAAEAMTRGKMSDDPLRSMVERDAEDIFLSQEMRAARLMAAARSIGEFQQVLAELMREKDGGRQPADVTSELLAQNQGNSTGSPLDAILGQAQAQRGTLQGPGEVRGPVDIPSA